MGFNEVGVWVVGATVATGACEVGLTVDGERVLGLFVTTTVVGEWDVGLNEVGVWVVGATVTTGACEVGLTVDGAWVTTAAVGEWDVGLNEVGM